MHGGALCVLSCHLRRSTDTGEVWAALPLPSPMPSPGQGQPARGLACRSPGQPSGWPAAGSTLLWWGWQMGGALALMKPVVSSAEAPMTLWAVTFMPKESAMVMAT